MEESSPNTVTNLTVNVTADSTNPDEFAGKGASDDVKRFLEVFLPLANMDTSSEEARRREWPKADLHGNDALSLTMMERWVERLLVASLGQKDGAQLYKKFFSAIIRAFTATREVPDAPSADYIDEPHFRLLVANLCFYALAIDAFTVIDSGSTTKTTGNDRLSEAEWLAGCHKVSTHGFTALAGDGDDNAVKEIFSHMDDNSGGTVLLTEFCNFLKEAEIRSGTFIGSLVSGSSVKLTTISSTPVNDSGTVVSPRSIDALAVSSPGRRSIKPDAIAQETQPGGEGSEYAEDSAIGNGTDAHDTTFVASSDMDNGVTATLTKVETIESPDAVSEKIETEAVINQTADDTREVLQDGGDTDVPPATQVELEESPQLEDTTKGSEGDSPADNGMIIHHNLEKEAEEEEKVEEQENGNLPDVENQLKSEKYEECPEQVQALREKPGAAVAEGTTSNLCLMLTALIYLACAAGVIYVIVRVT